MSGCVECEILCACGGVRVLPFDDWTACHDACGSVMLDVLRDAHIRCIPEPRSIFSSLIPARVLMANGQPPAIIADAAVDMALPATETRRGVSQGQRTQPLQRHLVDFKCIYGGGGCYRTARARDEQSGAVAERAHVEWPAYQRAARELDSRFHHPRTPVYDRLLSFGQVRCLVLGAYGEGSPDVHHFLRAAAQQRASRSWRRQGSRTQSEAYGVWLQVYRRDIGVAAVREHARLRLRRVPLIGVDRAVLRARGVQRHRQVVGQWEDGTRRDDFLAFQAFGGGLGAGAA